MFALPISFGWMAHLKIQEKNISVEDKAKHFVVLFFQQNGKIFTFSSHSKFKWKPKQNRSQRNVLCCAPNILFFTGSFTGLLFISFWKGDEYWNLLFSPPEKTFSPVSISHTFEMISLEKRKINNCPQHRHFTCSISILLLSFRWGSGTFVTPALTSLLLIHILREQKSAFHALVIRIPFCHPFPREGRSSGACHASLLWAATTYAGKTASSRNCNKTSSVTARLPTHWNSTSMMGIMTFPFN